MTISKPDSTKRKQYIITILGFVGFVGILVFGLWVSDPNKGEKTALEKAREASRVVSKDFGQRDSVTAEELWVAKSEQRMKNHSDTMESIEAKNKRLEDRLESVLKTLNEMKKNPDKTSSSSTLSTPINLDDNQDSEIVGESESVKFPPAPKAADRKAVVKKIVPSASNTVPNRFEDSDENGVFHISLRDDDSDIDSKESKNAETYIPSGSFATAIMLAGVDAPTGGLAQTNPSPVLFRVKEDARLPNFWRSEIKECHVIGEAAGNMASERAEIRLNSLSCVLSTGDIIEKKIKGWVTGEDGKAGVRGRVVSKQGRLIAMAAMSGLFSGFGESVDQQYQQVSQSALGTVTNVDPKKVFQSGLAKGFGTSMEKVSEFYMERANETYPIIEVSAKRVVEIVLSEGVDLGDMSLSGNTLNYSSY